MYYYTYHAFDEFREEYRKKFGKEVYVGPYMQVRWCVDLIPSFQCGDSILNFDAGALEKRCQLRTKTRASSSWECSGNGSKTMLYLKLPHSFQMQS